MHLVVGSAPAAVKCTAVNFSSEYESSQQKKYKNKTYSRPVFFKRKAERELLSVDDGLPAHKKFTSVSMVIYFGTS
jgi:hypothetical protein